MPGAPRRRARRAHHLRGEARAGGEPWRRSPCSAPHTTLHRGLVAASRTFKLRKRLAALRHTDHRDTAAACGEPELSFRARLRRAARRWSAIRQLPGARPVGASCRRPAISCVEAIDDTLRQGSAARTTVMAEDSAASSTVPSRCVELALRGRDPRQALHGGVAGRITAPGPRPADHQYRWRGGGFHSSSACLLAEARRSSRTCTPPGVKVVIAHQPEPRRRSATRIPWQLSPNFSVSRARGSLRRASAWWRAEAHARRPHRDAFITEMINICERRAKSGCRSPHAQSALDEEGCRCLRHCVHWPPSAGEQAILDLQPVGNRPSYPYWRLVPRRQ